MDGIPYWRADKLSAAECAALRRYAGRMMDCADATALMAFYRIRENGVQSNRDKYLFAALCMESLWHVEDEYNKRPPKLPIEQILKKLIKADDPEENRGLKLRVQKLLDTAWGDDGFLLGKICDIMRIIRNSDIGFMPDCERLADDLRAWNYNSRRVQIKWIRAIYSSDSGDIDKGGVIDAD